MILVAVVPILMPMCLIAKPWKSITQTQRSAFVPSMAALMLSKTCTKCSMLSCTTEFIAQRWHE